MNRLEETVRRQRNRTVETSQIIAELMALAAELRDADARGTALGLTDEEIAFYDALSANESAADVLGDEVLRRSPKELVQAVRSNLTIDWTVRENVRAQLRVIVKRILRKHGFPPDQQESATRSVLEQAEGILGALSAE